MNDLFETDERWRKGGSKVESAPPLGPREEGGGGAPREVTRRWRNHHLTSLSRPPNPNAREAARPEKEIGLRERLAQVYRDLEMANSEVEALKPSAEYHGMRFQNADHELREAIHKREVSGQSYTLFELYDARVEAGHAWNPYRKKLSDAMNWRKSLMDEAAALNKELGT